MINLVIKPEQGIEAPETRSRGRPKSEVLKAHVQNFLDMPLNWSFFVEGATRRDLEFLRKPVMALGANIEIRYTPKDEIYGVPGTRVWRRHGLIDEL